MNDADQVVLDSIERALASRPFTIAVIESLFDVTLTPREGVRQPRFEVVEGRPDPARYGVSHVELRVRRDVASDAGGILILTMGPASGLTRQRMNDSFGEGVSSPPAPSQPVTEPNYVAHATDWGTLRFGYTRDRGERLVKAVLDAA